MAHEKVYGICEDKCKEEVVPKGNFVVIDDITLLPHETANLDYPSGFNQNNTIVVSMSIRTAEKISSNDYLRMNDYTEVNLTGEDIQINNLTENFYYGKLVLMKLD